MTGHAVTVRAIEICALDTRDGVTFRVFTDSQAAMEGLMDDRPGPGQDLARRGIEVTSRGIHDREGHIRIARIPGYRGIPGNEIADCWVVGEAQRAEVIKKARKGRRNTSRRGTGATSLTFLKARARVQADAEWREDITGRCKGVR